MASRGLSGPVGPASDTIFTSGVGAAWVGASAEGAPEEATPSAADRDVVLRILALRMPLDVVRWWEAGPGREPERWTHPLSEWERKYVEKLSASSVPEPVRMWPPVEPERLTPRQLEEAERLFGNGPEAAESYANRENRRRIVHHYVNTHPATIGLSLIQYGFMRDINPVSFSLERGWQVGRGKEMFTEQDVSRLGAAAEFFTALAVGVATNKVLLSVRPAPPEGLRPPAGPAVGSVREGAAPPDAVGKVVPLERARAGRSTPQPGTQPSVAMEEPPLASTGTGGPPPGRGGGASRPPTTTRDDPNSGARSGGSKEQPEAAGPAGIAAGDECSGQLHHVISKRIAEELEKYPRLRGLYTARDPRFVTRAADKASHNGYQQWHRDVDREVIHWLDNHRSATPAEFELKLRKIYNRPQMRERFPNGF